MGLLTVDCSARCQATNINDARLPLTSPAAPRVALVLSVCPSLPLVPRLENMKRKVGRVHDR